MMAVTYPRVCAMTHPLLFITPEGTILMNYDFYDYHDYC